VFLWCYGPYLARLEQWAPPTSGDSPQTASVQATTPLRSEVGGPLGEPAPTSVVVALATTAYGLLIVLAGLIWTQGSALLFNLLGGGMLLACAAAVWWLGRSQPSGGSRHNAT